MVFIKLNLLLKRTIQKLIWPLKKTLVMLFGAKILQQSFLLIFFLLIFLLIEKLKYKKII